MSYKGKYRVKNKDKYIGNINNVRYLSSWELAYMKWCDNCTRVLQWGSEEIIIPYRCPTDNKVHRYYTDFYVRVVNEQTGVITENIIEIKPFKQTKAPRQGKNRRAYVNKVNTYVKNQAKWTAADTYAKSKGMNFIVLTEKDLFKAR